MNGLNKAFNRWWDSDELVADNPFGMDTAMFWAWEGWQAALKNSVMTDEEYEQAMADEGQRRMLEIDIEVREMIKEAVEAEREACAKVAEDTGNISGNMNKTWRNGCFDAAFAIRARGQG